MKNNRNTSLVKHLRALSLDQLLYMSGGGVFQLTRLAMVRALEIHFGGPVLIEHVSTDKPTTIALTEIAYGRIGPKINKSKRKTNKEIMNEEG